MLNRAALSNVELIKSTAKRVWGDNAEFGEMEILDRPYSEFVWPMRLYGKVEILLAYDRSTLSIGIPTENGRVTLRSIAKATVYWGFDALQPENLLHNFKVLDRVVKAMK